MSTGENGVHPLLGDAARIRTRDEFFRFNRNRPQTPPPQIQTCFGLYKPLGDGTVSLPGPNECWNCGIWGHRSSRCPLTMGTFCYGCGYPGKRLSNCPSCYIGWMMGYTGPQYPRGKEPRPPRLSKQVVYEQQKMQNRHSEWKRCDQPDCRCQYQPQPESEPSRLEENDACYADQGHRVFYSTQWANDRSGFDRPRTFASRRGVPNPRHVNSRRSLKFSPY